MNMQVKIVAICKDENEYLDEWMNHHRGIGIDSFIIGDNQSKVPIKEGEGVTVIPWDDNIIGSQMRFYDFVCKSQPKDVWLAMIDIDEFIRLKGFDSIQDCITYFRKTYYISALGMYWRFLGQPEPYFESRQPVENYKWYHPNGHIKTVFLNEDYVRFHEPHSIRTKGRYTDELGRRITGPIGEHTSEFIWIDQYWTRSIPEFQEKIIRGSGDKVVRVKTMEDFYNYNDSCTWSV